MFFVMFFSVRRYLTSCKFCVNLSGCTCAFLAAVSSGSFHQKIFSLLFVILKHLLQIYKSVVETYVTVL